WPHGPERRDGATRPAQERNAALVGPALPLQPAARRGRIGHTLPVTANLAFAHRALRAEPARREAVDKKNGKPLLGEALAPIGKTPDDLAVRAEQPRASVQAYDDRIWSRTLRPVENRVERCIAVTHINHIGRRRRGGGREQSEGGKSEAHRATVPW